MVGTDVASIGATGGITGRSIGSVCGRAGAPSTPSIAPMVDSTQDATDRAVQRAERLRELHRPGEPLVLVNVWDVLGARVVAAVDLPVTGDLERGYGRTPEHVAASVLRLLTAGGHVRAGVEHKGHVRPALGWPSRPRLSSMLQPTAPAVSRRSTEAATCSGVRP